MNPLKVTTPSTESYCKQTPQPPTTISTPSPNTALVDDTKSDWASTRTQPHKPAQKVVIITVSNRKLTTSENTDPHQNKAANIPEVVAANPSKSTTTSTQP